MAPTPMFSTVRAFVVVLLLDYAATAGVQAEVTGARAGGGGEAAEVADINSTTGEGDINAEQDMMMVTSGGEDADATMITGGDASSRVSERRFLPPDEAVRNPVVEDQRFFGASAPSNLDEADGSSAAERELEMVQVSASA